VLFLVIVTRETSARTRHFFFEQAPGFRHWLRHKLRQLNKALGLLTYSNVFFVFRLEHVFISGNPNNISFLIVNLWDYSIQMANKVVY
jgi:hypothetical protein